MSENRLVNIYVTCGNEEEAARIASTLVHHSLAACANLLKDVRSIYRWNGQIYDEQEVAMILKSRAGKMYQAIEMIKELHGYEEPCIEVWDVDHVPKGFAKWVVGETTLTDEV